MSTLSSETRWTVEERAWKQELPDLPDEVIALLAAPVVVSASTWTEPRPSPSPSPSPVAAHAPRFLAPAPPLRSAQRRTAGRAVPRAAARTA